MQAFRVFAGLHNCHLLLQMCAHPKQPFAAMDLRSQWMNPSINMLYKWDHLVSSASDFINLAWSFHGWLMLFHVSELHSLWSIIL